MGVAPVPLDSPALEAPEAGAHTTGGKSGSKGESALGVGGGVCGRRIPSRSGLCGVPTLPEVTGCVGVRRGGLLAPGGGDTGRLSVRGSVLMT